MVDPGEGAPLFLDETEAKRAEKIFLDTVPPPLSHGLDPALYNNQQLCPLIFFSSI